MALVLVSDTSILIDLERGEIIEAAFKTTYEIAVPDLLYKRELAPHGGPALVKLGLKVLEVDEVGVGLAQKYRTQEKRLSLADVMSLALAKRQACTLLTGDGALRALAESESVECHGLFWLFDVFEQQAILSFTRLHDALDRIGNHPRCRLPQDELARRLLRYRSSKD
jgi:hypothetical protein